MIQLKVEVGAGELVYDRRKLKAIMRAAGSEVAAIARQLVRSSVGAGRSYYVKGSLGGLGRYRASAPGQAPVSITGKLASSMRVNVSRDGEFVSIRDSQFYALFLEKGAAGGGGNTRNRANILPAGQVGSRGQTLRGKNRMKRSAISQTRVLKPRPFLTTALGMREASIASRIRLSLNQDIRFVRVKA